MLSMTLLALILLVASWFAKPYLVRWRTLNNLDSDIPAQRELALNYVYRAGANDPSVLQGAINRMDRLRDPHFASVMLLFDRMGKWRRPLIPPGPWLRWLEVIAADKDAKARIIAAQRMADLADMPGEPRVIAMLERLIGDEKEDVRYNAMIAAAELWAGERKSPVLRGIVARATGDANAEIARQAWIFLGLMGVPDGLKSDWRKTAPRAALPMFWAVTRASPTAAGPALEAARDASTPAALRAEAVFALAYSRSPDAADALLAILHKPIDGSLSEEDAALLWRAVLASGAITDPARASGAMLDIQRIAEQAAAKAYPNDPALAPLAVAAAYRLGTPLTFKPSDAIPADADQRAAFAALAAAESTNASAKPPPLYPDSPGIYRLAVVERQSASFSPALLDDVFGSDDAVLRDQACLVAATRLNAKENESLARRLLLSFDDNELRSGAVLAGLTGARPRGRSNDAPDPAAEFDLLPRRGEIEDDWLVKQVLLLALWMQGRNPDLDNAKVHNLLTRSDLPGTTILLAMLHKRDHAAFEYLLNPRGEPRMDLTDLFIHKRWWRVFKHYLPKDAPLDLWLWADTEVQQFQIDVLRNWYLLERRRLGGGAPAEIQAEEEPASQPATRP